MRLSVGCSFFVGFILLAVYAGCCNAFNIAYKDYMMAVLAFALLTISLQGK